MKLLLIIGLIALLFIGFVIWAMINGYPFNDHK